MLVPSSHIGLHYLQDLALQPMWLTCHSPRQNSFMQVAHDGSKGWSRRLSKLCHLLMHTTTPEMQTHRSAKEKRGGPGVSSSEVTKFDKVTISRCSPASRAHQRIPQRLQASPIRTPQSLHLTTFQPKPESTTLRLVHDISRPSHHSPLSPQPTPSSPPPYSPMPAP